MDKPQRRMSMRDITEIEQILFEYTYEQLLQFLRRRQTIRVYARHSLQINNEEDVVL